MDPMSYLASQHNDGLARRRAADGWSGRPTHRRPILRRIGRRARTRSPESD